jgi:hypothetical protein
LLSNYNIKYICTIYTRLDTCLMSISRFSLRDKVTLRLLKLYFLYSGHKAKRLVLQCSNGVSSNRGKNKKLTAQRSNSDTVWFNFQTYIYIYTHTHTHPHIYTYIYIHITVDLLLKIKGAYICFPITFNMNSK